MAFPDSIQIGLILLKPLSNALSKPLSKALVTVVLLATAGLSPSSIAAQQYDATLFVDVNAGVGGSTQADGSAQAPFSSLTTAVQHAVYVNKRNGLSTEIVVAPGTYRESVNFSTYTNHTSNQPENDQPILIRAQYPETRPVISGADVFEDWQTSGLLYRTHWTSDWGVTDVQFGGAELSDIVGRREMVFVDGQRLTPVLTRAALVPGSFFADEAADSLFVYPVSAPGFEQAMIEVAVRDRVYQQDFEDNVTIRNLVFENAADPWIEGVAGVRITSSNNLTVEDCEFRSSNWTGLIVSQAENVVLRRLKINDNGGRGLAVWRLKHALVEDSETSGNNWRGFLDLFTGWTVGNNVDSSHDITFRRHTATDNFARGLWFDTDIVNGVLEESVLRDNKNDGLFIEATQGPVFVRGNLIENNGRDGIFSGNTENLHILGNVIRDNLRAAVRLSGRNEGREVEDFETGERYLVEALNWVMRDNRFSGSGPYLMGTTVDPDTWGDFLATLDSDGNDWCHPAFGAVFQVAGGALITLDQWRALTGQDAASTYCAPSTVGNEGERNSDLEVSAPYPNPTADIATFAITGIESSAAYTVSVFDLLGRKVRTAAVVTATTTGSASVSLDVSMLAPGTYVARVSIVGRSSTSAVVTRTLTVTR